MLSALTPFCSTFPPLSVQGTMASSKMRGRKLSVIKISPSVHLLSALLFSALIDQNAGGREWGKVITLKSIKVVSVPEITDGYCQGMFLDIFFTDFPVTSLRDSKQSGIKAHNTSLVALYSIHILGMHTQGVSNVFICMGDSPQTVTTRKARSHVWRRQR